MNVHYEIYKTSQSIFFTSDSDAYPVKMYSEPQCPISKPWYSYLKTLMLPSSYTSRLSNSEKTMVDSDPSIQVGERELFFTRTATLKEMNW